MIFVQGECLTMSNMLNRESCDTITSDKEIHEAITAACHSTICTSNDDNFYKNQPSGPGRCLKKDGEQVTRSVRE